MPEILKKTTKELIELVRRSEDISARREALIALSYQKDASLYELFMDQLEDKSRSIRHAAVIVLGRYGNPMAIDELIKPKILNSPEMNIRWAAVVALGRLGNYQVIDYLVKAAGDPEWVVRNQAVTELKEKIKEITGINKSQTSRILVRLLAMEDNEIVEMAIEGLLKLGPLSYGLLVDALKSPSPEMRKNAASALGQMQADLAVAPIIQMLQDADWQVRRSAVEALGHSRDRRAVEPLVQCLSDNVEKVQRQARLSLVGLGELSVDPILNALSHEKSKFILRAMILTLGDIADTKSVPALVKHLSSSYFVVRRAAVQALIRFGPSVISNLLSLLNYNESSIKALVADAGCKDQPHLQIRAIHALGGLEDHRAVKVLKKLAQTGEDDVQAAATEALVSIGCAAWSRCSALQVLRVLGDRSHLSYILHMLEDDSDNVRLEAVLALAQINGPDAIRPLVDRVVSDRDPNIRFEAIRQLRTIGVGYPEVQELALKALEDSNRDVRSQAAWLLGNFQDERSIPALLTATSDPHWSVRESADISLHNFGLKAIPYLINALNHKSWTTQFRAARMLGELGDVSAIKPLEKLIGRKRLRREVKQRAEVALLKLREKLSGK
ncbi:HEAT repeat domain-containing protein [bacterium]|nr:HEAT repeat domain-containing protein [bacterium]